jgi:hypothetical protein
VGFDAAWARLQTDPIAWEEEFAERVEDRQRLLLDLEAPPAGQGGMTA